MFSCSVCSRRFGDAQASAHRTLGSCMVRSGPAPG
jgi:hypothetical protein